jgi:hypothetical protein
MQQAKLFMSTGSSTDAHNALIQHATHFVPSQGDVKQKGERFSQVVNTNQISQLSTFCSLHCPNHILICVRILILHNAMQYCSYIRPKEIHLDDDEYLSEF